MSDNKPKFLCDENIPRHLGAVAEEEGFEVDYLVDVAIGEADVDVLARAFATRRIVVTEDLDFGRLVFPGAEETHGVLLIRIPAWKQGVRADRLRRLLRSEAGRLMNSFAVLSEDTVRIRPLRPPRSEQAEEE